MQLLLTLSIQPPLFSSLLCPPEAHPDYKHEHLCILVSFGAEIVRNTIKSKNTEEKKNVHFSTPFSLGFTLA